MFYALIAQNIIDLFHSRDYYIHRVFYVCTVASKHTNKLS